MSAFDLTGRTALVTGASRNIGREIAVALGRAGASVLVHAARDRDALAETVAAVEAVGARAGLVVADLEDPASGETIVAAAEAAFGGLDILVNNAALFDASPTLEITPETYQRLFAVNVHGTLFTMQAAAKGMIARGRGGRIINMASQAGRRGEPLVAVYCATKAAVISLTQSVGLDLIRHRINVNAIAPGVVDGEHWDGVDALFAKWEGRPPGEKKRLVGQAVPYGRMGTAHDLVGMAIFLAGAESDYVVAQTYNVDGGNWLS